LIRCDYRSNDIGVTIDVAIGIAGIVDMHCRRGEADAPIDRGDIDHKYTILDRIGFDLCWRPLRPYGMIIDDHCIRRQRHPCIIKPAHPAPPLAR
jgi:hypothetical protein